MTDSYTGRADKGVSATGKSKPRLPSCATGRPEVGYVRKAETPTRKAPDVPRRRSVPPAAKSPLRDRVLRAKWAKDDKDAEFLIAVYEAWSEGLTQRDLASILGVTQETAWRWKGEGGKLARDRHRDPGLEQPSA